MKPIWSRCFLVLIASVLPFHSWAVTQNAPANEIDFAKRVKSSYYSVRALGLKRFQCTATPDWSAYAAALARQHGEANDSPRARAFLKEVDGIRYTVMVDLQGRPKITATPARPIGQEANPRVALITDAFKNEIEGFFGTSLNLLQYIDDIPAGKFHMTSATPERYILSNAETELEFDRDYRIKKLSLLPHSRGTYAVPSFTKTENGLFLQTEMEGSFMTGQSFRTSVQYEDTQGFKLPSRITQVNMSLGSVPSIDMEVVFSDYSLN
jgi:hypothetical protein